MRRVRNLLLCFGLLSVAIGGCLDSGGEGGSGCVASATGPMTVANSWAYDGADLREATGDLAIDVDDADNEGTVTGNAAEGSGDAALTWEVEFASFAGSVPFHDGGVETDLVEHGDTRVGGAKIGDTTIPKVDLQCVGWGPVTVRLNGDEITDDEVGLNLTGHFMVSTTGVRDDATGQIHDANGTAPYSPDRPGDATRESGDYEFWLIARTPASDEPPTIPPIVFSDTVSAPNYDRSWDFMVLSPATIDVDASARNAAAGPLIGQLDVTLLDATGGTVGSTQLGGTGQTTMSGITAEDAQAGPYALSVTGSGVQVDYTLTVTLTYPNGFLLVLFWEEGQVE